MYRRRVFPATDSDDLNMLQRRISSWKLISIFAVIIELFNEFSAQKLFNYWFSTCVNHEIQPFSRKYSIQIRQQRVKLLHDSTLNNSLPQQMCFQLRSLLCKARHQRAINQTMLSNPKKKLMLHVSQKSIFGDDIDSRDLFIFIFTSKF